MQETSTVEYISLETNFNVNVLKFELQYEWTPRQSVSQLHHHIVEGAHDIKCSQKKLGLKFCGFQRLSSNFTTGSHRKCSVKKIGVLKYCAVFTGKHLYQSLFVSCNFTVNETPAQEFSC